MLIEQIKTGGSVLMKSIYNDNNRVDLIGHLALESSKLYDIDEHYIEHKYV